IYCKPIKKAEVRGYFQKAGKNRPKKKPTATSRPIAKPSSRNHLDAKVCERTTFVVAQPGLPGKDQGRRSTSTMPLQQEKP
ncbi:hypothetical protein, partial [Janthinobacterium lividum]|uniref:hypothetical protein n=1 Tax=Janthinobacterium lividum TaxID=29581 RepID=UPI0039EBE3E3